MDLDNQSCSSDLQAIELDDQSKNSSNLHDGGLLYDQTQLGRPQLFDEATKKYLPLPNIPMENLHQFTEGGVVMMDEIVACSGGYLCYNLKQIKCFMVCNPRTGSKIFIPHYDDIFSNCCILSVHMEVANDENVRIVVVAQSDHDLSPGGFMRYMTAYYFDKHKGDSWVVGSDTHLRISNENLPLSSCKLEGAIYHLGFDERFKNGNPLVIWKHNNNMDQDRWYQVLIVNSPSMNIEWMWLMRGNKEKYRQTSPALFACNQKLFIMSGFVKQVETENLITTERRIGLWRLDRSGDGLVMELEVEFPKAMWGLRMNDNYDLAQFGNCFAVYDVKYGCGRAYDYMKKIFYTFPSCDLAPGCTNLKAFDFKHQPSVV